MLFNYSKFVGQLETFVECTLHIEFEHAANWTIGTIMAVCGDAPDKCGPRW
jgi:hypothetical protein